MIDGVKIIESSEHSCDPIRMKDRIYNMENGEYINSENMTVPDTIAEEI